MSKAFSIFLRDLRQIPRGVKLVVFVIFLRSLGWGFADPFFSIYLKSLSANYSEIGLYVSFMGVLSFLTLIILTRLEDKVKDTRIIEDGEILYLFSIFSYVIAGLLKNVSVLVFALILNGLAYPMVMMGSEAYVRKHSNGGYARAFGYYTALDFLGWTMGMVLGAFMIDWYGLNYMFLFVLPSIFASFFILKPIQRENGSPSLLSGIKRYFHRRADIMEVLKSAKTLTPQGRFFMLISFFDGMVLMFLFIFIPLLALKMNLEYKQISLLTATIFMPFIFSFFFSEIADRKYKLNIILLALLIASVSFLSLYFIVHKNVLMILAPLITLALAILRPAYNGALTQLTPRNMLGQVTGLTHLMFRIGMILGPLISGFVADRYGIQISFLMIAFLALALSGLTFLVRRKDMQLLASHPHFMK